MVDGLLPLWAEVSLVKSISLLGIGPRACLHVRNFSTLFPNFTMLFLFYSFPLSKRYECYNSIAHAISLDSFPLAIMPLKMKMFIAFSKNEFNFHRCWSFGELLFSL